MAELGNDLLAIEVDADDYAETATDDAPAVPRTFQSEADFQAIKATYSAKTYTDNSNESSNYNDLLAAVPVLSADSVSERNSNGSSKVKFGKKDFQLLGYVVGEFYFDKKYSEVMELCGRVRERCDVDRKMEESLKRWIQRCRARTGVVDGVNGRESSSV